MLAFRWVTLKYWIPSTQAALSTFPRACCASTGSLGKERPSVKVAEFIIAGWMEFPLVMKVKWEITDLPAAYLPRNSQGDLYGGYMQIHNLIRMI